MVGAMISRVDHASLATSGPLRVVITAAMLSIVRGRHRRCWALERSEMAREPGTSRGFAKGSC